MDMDDDMDNIIEDPVWKEGKTWRSESTRLLNRGLTSQTFKESSDPNASYDDLGIPFISLLSILLY